MSHEEAADITHADGSGVGRASSVVLPGLGLVFGTGGMRWPDSIGIGVNVEGEAISVRTLLSNSEGAEPRVVPFLSFLKPGPPLPLAAATLLPGETELLIGASLDMPKIFDEFLKMSAVAGPDAQHTSDGAIVNAQVAALEKQFGFKVREELLPALGSEIAISLPLHEWFSSSQNATASSAP